MENRERLENRADKRRRKSAKWWNYSFPLHKEFYNLPKIFCSRRSSQNTFCLDEDFEYLSFSNMTVTFATNEKLNIKYILALLNSKLLNFRYKTIGKQTGGGIFEYFPNSVGKLPITEIPLEDQKPFIELVDQIINLKEQKYDLIRLFRNLIKNTGQNKSFKPLKYYIDLKNAKDYTINMAKTEKLIAEDKKAKPREYKVREDENFLVINVIYDDGSDKDVIKLYFEDGTLREFFHLAIFLAVDGKTKAYRTEKEVLDTLLNDIKIPRGTENKKKDVENIRMIMKTLEDEYNKMLQDNYRDSSIQELNLENINRNVKEIDHNIDQMVYGLYGLTDEEIRIVEESLK